MFVRSLEDLRDEQGRVEMVSYDDRADFGDQALYISLYLCCSF